MTEMEYHPQGLKCLICGLVVPNADLAARHVKADWRKIEASLERWTRKVKQ